MLIFSQLVPILSTSTNETGTTSMTTFVLEIATIGMGVKGKRMARVCYVGSSKSAKEYAQHLNDTKPGYNVHRYEAMGATMANRSYALYS